MDFAETTGKNDLTPDIHESLDDDLAIYKQLGMDFESQKGRLLNVLLAASIEHYSNIWPIVHMSASACKEFLETNHQVRDLLEEAYHTGKYAAIRNLPEFHKKVPSNQEVQSTLKVLHKAYNRPFRGTVAQDFVDFLKKTDQEVQERREILYANVISIVQSSGTGKSRLLTETGKYIFTLPICLRHPDETGYPPSDTSVYQFFEGLPSHENRPESDLSFSAHVAIACFIGAAYQTMLNRLENALLTYKTAEALQSYWHGVMECKEDRSERDSFFFEVVKVANAWRNKEAAEPQKLKSPKGPISDADRTSQDIVGHARKCYDRYARPAGEKLANFISSLSPQKTLIVTYFDEAHKLLVSFWVLLRLLGNQRREMHMWYVFLGTNSSVGYFHPLPNNMHSLRLCRELRRLLPPFIALGFDQNMICNNQGPATVTMGYIQSIEHLSKYGRPMWNAQFCKGKEAELLDIAALKLLDAEASLRPGNINHVLATLSQRLSIDLVMASREAIELAGRGVAKHLRLLTGFSHDLKTFYTHSPSEPILALAAFGLIHGDRNSESSRLGQVLATFSKQLCKAGLIEEGLVGELAACTLLLLARDFAAPVNPNEVHHDLLRPVLLMDFLNELFGDNKWSGNHQKEYMHAFKDMYVNFTHWTTTKDVLPDEPSLQFLANLWARGGALQCAFNQESIDLLIPTYTGNISANENFDITRLSAVVVQVKYKANADTAAERALRPIGIPRGLSKPLPYLAVLLELGNETPFRTPHTKIKVTAPDPNNGSEYGDLVETRKDAADRLAQYKDRTDEQSTRSGAKRRKMEVETEQEAEVGTEQKTTMEELQKRLKHAQTEMDAHNKFTISVRGASAQVYGILEKANIGEEFASLLNVAMPPPTNQDTALQHMKPFERLEDTSAHMAWMSAYKVGSEEGVADELMEEDKLMKGDKLMKVDP